VNARLVAAIRARPAAAMSLATAASRATGFLRTLALAWALGVTTLADAYNLANTAPNMLFQLAAGGVLSSAVVPLLTQAASERERRDHADVLFGGVLAVGATATIVLALVAPVVLRVLTLGAPSATRPALVEVGTTWLVLFAPQVLAYAVSVFSVGVLTSRGRLFLGALAPVATNLLTLGGVLMFVLAGSRRPDVRAVTAGQVRWLGLLTTLGVATMAVLQLATARRVERGLRPRLSLRHVAVRHALGMAPWIALYVIVNQVGLAAVTAFAATTAGGVSAYQWAFTVMQLPHALIAVSIISAAFPRIAAGAGEGAEVTSTAVDQAVARLLWYLVPAAVALAGLAPVVATAVVGPSGSRLVGAALVGFAVSLVPFSTFQLLTRVSYAFRDGRSPAIVNVAVNVVNVGLDVAVLAITSHATGRIAGLAIGHAASYVAGTLLLARRLRTTHGVHVAVPTHMALRASIGAVVAAAGWLTSHAAGPRTQITSALVIAGGAAVVAAAAAALHRRRPGFGLS
jgi:putative peptidoglycan lipid II flippase